RMGSHFERCPGSNFYSGRFNARECGVMADLLAAADRSSLAAERGSVNMAIAGVLIVERGREVSDHPFCRRLEQLIHPNPRHLARLATGPLERASPIALEATQALLSGEPPVGPAEVRRASAVVAALARSRPSAPRLPVNGTLSPNRAYAFTRTPLAPIKAFGK